MKKFFKNLSSIIKGNYGEKLAESYLRKKGFEIIERNYRLKFGEVDLIAKKKKLLVFVEVKSDFSNKEFGAEEKVDFKKQQKILRVARYYILKNPNLMKKIEEIRFDVIVVKNDEEVVHYESAFFEEGDFTRY
ncbi:MAG: YraN family protein [Thermodesulfobacteria bacterium]|nr:YraN family protein [Thermodesulfobacteriota bacterium]